MKRIKIEITCSEHKDYFRSDWRDTMNEAIDYIRYCFSNHVEKLLKMPKDEFLDTTTWFITDCDHHFKVVFYESL